MTNATQVTDRNADHSFTCDVERIADEIIAQRPGKRPVKSQYSGLKSRAWLLGRKYREHAYSIVHGLHVRRLSAREVAEFQRQVQLCIDPRSRRMPATRRAVV